MLVSGKRAGTVACGFQVECWRGVFVSTTPQVSERLREGTHISLPLWGVRALSVNLSF